MSFCLHHWTKNGNGKVFVYTLSKQEKLLLTKVELEDAFVYERFEVRERKSRLLILPFSQNLQKWN